MFRVSVLPVFILLSQAICNGAGPVDYEGDVQLMPIDQAGEHDSGVVHVYHQGIWGSVCDDETSDLTADVVCRQLGLGRGRKLPSSEPPGGGKGVPIWMDEVTCAGAEERLVDCPHTAWGDHDCVHSEDLVVNCSGLVDVPAELGDVRLADGDTYSGRVEVFMHDSWGTICDDNFSEEIAQVVCRQLGYGGGHPVWYGEFGAGTGPIHIYNLKCSEEVNALLECDISSEDGDVYCSHAEDAGVVCDLIRPEDHPVRLANGTRPWEGRVEIFHEGRWGSVCNTNWTDLNSQVVCRQLGYPPGGRVGFLHPGPGDSPVWLEGIMCEGDETSLHACARRYDYGDTTCQHSDDVGVICDPGTLRLADGEGPWEGRVEVFHQGRWGSVCDDGWDDTDATVACQQLGYSGGRVGTAHPALEETPIWLDEVACRGNEISLDDCPHNAYGDTNCYHFEDAGAMCNYGRPLPDLTVEVRLMDGPGVWAGRVEVLYRGEWGTICDDLWDDDDASVVCRQLGYNGTARALHESYYGQGEGTILLDSVECIGIESNLAHCSHEPWGRSDCGHWEDAAVDCVVITGEVIEDK